MQIRHSCQKHLSAALFHEFTRDGVLLTAGVMRGSNENDRALRDDANLSNAPGLLYDGI